MSLRFYDDDPQRWTKLLIKIFFGNGYEIEFFVDDEEFIDELEFNDMLIKMFKEEYSIGYEKMNECNDENTTNWVILNMLCSGH